MDEIRSLKDAMGPDLNIEELEARLEAVMPMTPEDGINEPCVWACECFATHY